jgi:hypothetical protein
VALPPVLLMMTRGMRWAAGEWETSLGLTLGQVYGA